MLRASPAMSETPFVSLDTPRLTLRRLRDADRAAFAAYRDHPEVARFQSWSSYDEVAAAALILGQRSVEPGTPGTWFQFAIERRADGRLIGDCGLRTEESDPRRGEIGFTLARAHQRSGYATEAVGRMLEHAFADLGFQSIRAVTDVLNAASIAVLERLGFRREAPGSRMTWFKGRWSEEYDYELSAAAWRSRREAAGPGAPDGQTPGGSLGASRSS
jgi:RimJ/RimL family protein N-acetyltransferase